jgi:beta-lactamase regulating signal transducer with metallopeptidase domain
MPNDMNLVAFQIASFALAYVLHSTVLLGGTWLFLRAARVRSWALRERIWKLAMVLPLMTAAIPLPASWSRLPVRLDVERLLARLPRTEPHMAPVEELQRHPLIAVRLAAEQSKSLDAEDAVPAAEPTPVSTELRRLPAVSLSTERQPTEPRILETEPTAVHGTSATAVKGICYTVLTFFILGTLHVIRRSLAFARSLRHCRPVRDESICYVLADLLCKANVRRRVRLLESTADRQPAAFGLFRWTIVLPQALIPTLQLDELRALLGHEVAHLARGDASWLWIGRILCACFAFQPLNFLARAQLRLAAEFLSDEWAVRNSANRFALARCLTRVAEWTVHLPPQPIELAAVGPRTNLSERVERLVLERRRSDSWDGGRRRWLVWAAAFIAAFGLECSAPRTSLLAEPPRHAAVAGSPRAIELSQPNTKPMLADALQSLGAETRDLLSELKRVDSLLKQATPSDPAIEAIAARLESRVARLTNTQARLIGLQETASGHAEPTSESRGPSGTEE